MKAFINLTLFTFLICATASAEFLYQVDEKLDQWADALIFSTEDENFQLEFGVESTLSFYYKDSGFIGWIFPHDTENRDNDVLSARLTITADAYYSDWLYGFTKFRVDDGFHPGLSAMKSNKTSEDRFDEVFLVISPEEFPLTIKGGRFAPSFGNFFGRHDPWDGPLITEPQVYNLYTSVLENRAMPDAASFAALRDAPDNVSWVPVIWGPLYNQGVELATAQGPWDASFAVMNSAVSAGTQEWNDNMDLPNYYMRLSYAFDPQWAYGFSASFGPYMRDVSTGLPAGKSVEDYDQQILGLDLKYSKHKWEVWSELYLNRFEVPNVGNADSLSYYIESKYKLSPKYFIAGRWNQQFYDTINVAGRNEDYDNDIYRIDIGFGAKWSRHLLSKIQYSYQHQDASFQNAEHMIGFQSSVKF